VSAERRYAEPTAQQAEEAAALVFLAETQKALRNQEHIWDLKLELAVSYGFHNQHIYRVHAVNGAGEAITGEQGDYVHPGHGTPQTAAWSLGIAARSAAKRKRANEEALKDGPVKLAGEPFQPPR
jgi:hypothetical protein